MKCIVVLTLSLAACGGSNPVPPQATVPGGKASEGARGVRDAKLAALLVEHWDWTLRSYPVWATKLGDHRFDSLLSDNSFEAIERRRGERDAFLLRATQIDPVKLGANDRVTLSLFISELESSQRLDACDSELWSVSAQSNPLEEFGNLPERHIVRDRESGRALLRRYRAIPTSIDRSIANLERGLRAGLVGNRHSLGLTIEMIEKHLAKPVEEWSLSKAPSKWPDFAGREEISVALREVVKFKIRPALERYHEFVVSKLLPAGRGPDRVGLVALSNGTRCYEARLRDFTGMSVTAEELHGIGLAQISAINAEMISLGSKLFNTGDLREIIDRLRNDQTLYYEDAEQIVRDARAAVGKARSAIPQYFGTLPAADVVVVPIPDYAAPYTTIAYYSEPHADGSKPGEYFINTYKPPVRPRFEMQVLTYHESIPGHHLQIAISQERDELPAFRRYGGNTAFVEGWALYTERLADEMKLYDGDLDRMGMLSFDAWRAARLVVDTGIHAKGWTRAQAEDFMLRHTALSASNIRNEVDRYIAWPGQAVAYKVGQLKILELRRRAKDALGARFELPSFHDVVLQSGAVSLQVLEANVLQWIAATKR